MKNLAFASLFALVGAAACGEAEELYNCADICNRYDECVDDDYDVTSCVDECEGHSDEDEAFADQAAACQDCLDDDASCAEDVVCADECAGVIIASS